MGEAATRRLVWGAAAREESFRFGLLDQPALLHHHDAATVAAARPRSWVIRMVAMPRSAAILVRKVHHDLLRRDVEAGGRLVGDQ